MVINICLIKGATEERGGWEKEAKWKWDFVQKYLDQTPVWKLSIETLQVRGMKAVRDGLQRGELPSVQNAESKDTIEDFGH